jgi:hypothetical protein
MTGITPNLFAMFALLLWPLVALCLFQARPVGQAILWTILGAHLLLPVGASIKFAMVPAFDKSSIATLSALLGCFLAGRQPLRFAGGFKTPEVLILMLLVCPFITAELNSDPIAAGATRLPGTGDYDALSASVAQFIFFVPFLLGRQILRTPADNVEVLRVLVVAGLLYSVPMLFEVRMSPQLHTWIYGYFPHSFVQQMRDGGFRPIVFMGHGLTVAFFAMTTLVAGAAFWRTRARVYRFPAGAVTAYLGVVLLLCKSLGSLVYAAALVPLIRFATPRLQIRVAIVLVSIALLYPTLRAADLFPERFLVDMAASIGTERAQSLKFRFDQEQQLLAHAWQRFSFGWGRFGRNRVYDEDSGRDLSVTDGHWIITMGQYGFIGFLAEFGLLALPVFRAASALRYAHTLHDQVFLAALALILAINVVDLLPNASLTPFTWLLAGTLLGRTEALRAAARERGVRWDVSSSLNPGEVGAKSQA